MTERSGQRFLISTCSQGAVAKAAVPAEPAVPIHQLERDRKFADSPLEEAGFEPSVPRNAPGLLVVSVLVPADLSVGGINGGDMSRP